MTNSQDVSVLDTDTAAGTSDHRLSSLASTVIHIIEPPRGGVFDGARPNLTARELEILRLISEGYDNTEISEQLHFGIGTIKLHVRTLLEKLKSRSRTEAAVRAVRMGLI